MKKFILKNITFAPDSHNKFTVDGKYVKLDGKPAQLLHYFLENAGSVRTNNQILDDVWAKSQLPIKH